MLKQLKKFHRHFATSRFAAKFGKEKEALIEELVELKSSALIKRCNEYGLSPAAKKGQNLQIIISHINRVDRQIFQDE